MFLRFIHVAAFISSFFLFTMIQYFYLFKLEKFEIITTDINQYFFLLLSLNAFSLSPPPVLIFLKKLECSCFFVRH